MTGPRLRRLLAKPARIAVLLGGLLAAWQLLVVAGDIPGYILPGPAAVLRAWQANAGLLLDNAAVTLLEIALGMAIAIVFGAAAALALIVFATARHWLLPVLVASQALPVFALAPVLIVWLGYGMASKVAMASLIIFFPVTASFYDGLRRAPRAWVEMAQLMTSGQDVRRLVPRWRRAARILLLIRLPAALPAAASGLRIAAAAAPIGAVVGEWVGASEGLGYLMLRANSRLQIDLMFAALLTLACMAVLLYVGIDRALQRALSWSQEEPSDDY